MQSKVKFKLHASYLIETIKRQSSGLPKALTELIMNSIDAGATRVDITLEELASKNYKFSVSDNGKGFTKTDIMNYFRYFGSPHEEHDAYFGCFRLGRGQIFAIADTVWRSNSYVFTVDIEKPLTEKNPNDLFFELNRTNVKTKGCFIQGTTYCNRVHVYEEHSLEDVIEEVTKICRYVPIPVYVNTKRISADLNAEFKRTDVICMEDEYAYYIFDNTLNESTLYNRGVRVKFGRIKGFVLEANIITKNQLSLTHSRNEVLDDCPIYNSILRQAQVHNEAILSNKSDKLKVDDEFITRFIISQVVNNTTNEIDKDVLTEIVKYRFLTTNTLSKVSLLELMHKQKVSVRWESDSALICEKIEREENTFFIVKSDVLYNIYSQLQSHYGYEIQVDELWWMVLNEFKKVLINYWISTQIKTNTNVIPVGSLEYAYFDVDDDKYRTKYTPLNSKNQVKQFTTEQRQLLNLADLANCLIIESGYFKKVRKLCLGSTDDPHVLAWTNGEDYICVNQNAVSLMNNLALKLFFTLIHEYCHENEFDRYHYHDEVFYQTYHDATHSSLIITALLGFQKAQLESNQGYGMVENV